MKRRKAYATLKAQRETRRVLLSFLVVCAIIAVVACIALIPRQPKEEAVKDNHTVKITNTNVHFGINPVHIWKSEEGATPVRKFTGGILTNNQGSPHVLTCGHPFWNITAGRKLARYYYQVIQPYDETLYPIASTMQIDKMEPGKTNATRDVIWCIPGPSTLISPVDNPEQRDGYRDMVIRFSKVEKTSICYSTVTGQKVEYVGAARLEDGTILAVLDYPGLEGESGTLFVEQGDHPMIYIQSRIIPVTDAITKTFGIPRTHMRVILCCMVKLH